MRRRLLFAFSMVLALTVSPDARTVTTHAVADPGPPPAETAPVPREGSTFAVPLYGELVRGFDAPEDDPFAPGHRGLDIAAPPATPVRAPADGIVVFAGSVAGNRSVTVDHSDGVRTTASWLDQVFVAQGQAVARGSVLGSSGHGHPAAQNLPPHVHLSARRDGAYIDPMRLYVGSSHADLLALVE